MARKVDEMPSAQFQGDPTSEIQWNTATVRIDIEGDPSAFAYLVKGVRLVILKAESGRGDEAEQHPIENS
jgi:hypothetical protein